LLEVEDLKDIDGFLHFGEWDEPPLHTRLAHLSFLEGMTVDGKNRVLTGAALMYAGRIVRAASDKLTGAARRDFLCVVTIMEWTGETPVVPRFLVSPRAVEELKDLRLVAPYSLEAKDVARWSKELGMLDEYLISTLRLRRRTGIF
jgi:hypothetical protein